MSSSNDKKYKTGNPIKKLLISRFLDNISSIVGKYRPDDITEIGCGEGYVLKKISTEHPKIKLIGYDLNKDAIRIARHNLPQASFSELDIFDISKKVKFTDMILALEIIEHLEDYEKALEELSKVKSEIDVISVPNEPYFSLSNLITFKNTNRLGKDPEHVNFWNTQQIKNVLNKYFSVINVYTPFPWSICVCKPIKYAKRN